MIYDYLKRGVVAGLIAGFAYGLYVALVANPLLNYVHGAGHDHDHGHGHDHSHAVSETTNAIVSVGSGILWGIFLAGVFAIAYYVLEPALPGRGAVKAAILAAAGFFSVSVVPWLVLPPAAPGAEATLGIDLRLSIYAGLVGVGLLVSGISIVSYRRLAPTGRGRALAVAAVPIGVVLVVLATVPPTIISHPDVADELVYTIQGGAALSQASLWAIIAGTFAWLQDRGHESIPGPRAGTEDELVTTS